MYNADEMGLLWHCLLNNIFTGGDEEGAVWFKLNKERLMVLCWLLENYSIHEHLKMFSIYLWDT
jgi:hypothetical protein